MKVKKQAIDNKNIFLLYLYVLSSQHKENEGSLFFFRKKNKQSVDFICNTIRRDQSEARKEYRLEDDIDTKEKILRENFHHRHYRHHSH